MIADHEISKCPELEVKSKIATIFVKKKQLKNILLRFIKLILTFLSLIEKKKKTDEVNEVNTYYLELIFVLLNIFQQQKLMKKVILTEILFLKKQDKKH